MDEREPPTEPSLVELMLDYQRGELPAFEALYGRLAPKLVGYLASLTWNRVQAEDLLQETFLQVHRARHTYLPPRPVEPWAFAIARHVFLMERRSAVRRRKVELSPPEELPDIPVPPSMEKLANRSLLVQALRSLSADRREAVLLHHVWGMSFSEIGSLLGIREGTAKLRAHRGIRALRDWLSQIETE